MIEKKTSVKKNNKLEETVAHLASRLSTIVDDLYMLKSDLKVFKENVAKDMTILVKEVHNIKE